MRNLINILAFAAALLFGNFVWGATAPTPPPPTDAISPIASAALEGSHLFKATAGNVVSISVSNSVATPGFLLLINATSIPADGAVLPLACAPVVASGTVNISYPYMPGRFQLGIVAVLSSGANCFTKTTGTLTGFFSGQVQ